MAPHWREGAAAGGRGQAARRGVSDGRHLCHHWRKGMRSSCLPWLYLLKSKHIECVSLKSAGAISVRSTAPLKHKKWVHVAVTAGVLGMRLYVDGKLSGQQKFPAKAQLVSNSDPFLIGQCPPGVQSDFGGAQSYGFKGYLLDCRYYLRRLEGESVEKYVSKHKPVEKKKPASSRIKGVSASKVKATKLSSRLLTEAISGRSSSKRASTVWTPSMDSEVMELFEHSRTSVTVNRPKALRAKETAAASGMDLKKSILGQVYLRSPGHRPFSVTFAGEGGTDAGGLFRELISELGEDLMNADKVRLLISCPNSRGYGDNKEKLIPNPAMSSSPHLSMWTFVGKLMGVAIRGHYYLDMDLPSMVWKPLVGIACDRLDLQEIDSLCYSVWKPKLVSKDPVERFGHLDEARDKVLALRSHKKKHPSEAEEAVKRKDEGSKNKTGKQKEVGSSNITTCECAVTFVSVLMYYVHILSTGGRAASADSQ